LREEEREQLERDAAGVPLGAYIKPRLFSSCSKQKDRKELARILAELGHMGLSENLKQIADAVKTGSIIVSPETEKPIQGCCLDVKWICYALISALGLVAENDYDP
jgi:hypothetical protein